MIDLIGWALLHSLWQGGALAVLLALLLWTTRRSAASTRYALSLGTLALMVALPLVTAASANRLRTEAAVAPRQAASENGATSPVGATPLAQQSARPNAPALDVATPGDPARIVELAGSAPTTALEDATVRGARWLQARMRDLVPWLVGIWLAGVLVLSARLIGGVRRLRQITRAETRPVDEPVRSIVARLSAQLGIRWSVRVIAAARGSVPFVVGWVRPAVFVPATLFTGLSPSQLEMLLAHELAHIRRWDVLVNLVQTVAETLLFYHPAAAWVSSRAREERENCCDDLALAVCGGDRAVYSGALLALEEWRDTTPALAAAATGGSLLRRVIRLTTGKPAHMDLGPRWVAGVVTIATALFTLGGAVHGSPEPAWQPTDRLVVGRDTVLGRPDTVLRHSGDDVLAARWRWAEDRSRENRFRTYWVGYAIDGDPASREWYYFDRKIPIRFGADNLTLGRATFDATDLKGLRFSGVPLGPLVGDRSAHRVAIFFGFERNGGGARLVRVHLGSFALPVHFVGWPLIWLGDAEDRESIQLVRELDGNRLPNEIRGDLVAVVGVHQDSRAVVPALIRWLDDDRGSDDPRREAAEWLGHHPVPAALAALSRTARSDRDRGVRKEAIETLAHMELDPATDTLMAFVRLLDESELRRTAIEALGHRTERRVIDFLLATVNGREGQDLRIEAVEALAGMPDGLGATAVVDLARRHPDVMIRIKAIEGIAEALEPERAVDVLADIVRRDEDRSVRVEATETLADVESDRAVATLRELVDSHPDEAVQVKAVEALGASHVHEQAIETLGRIATTHPRSAVQSAAAEALGGFEDPRAVDWLVRIVDTNTDESVQAKAVEALGDVHPHDAATRALTGMARNHPSGRVQRTAIEALGNVEDARASAALVDLARNHPDDVARIAAIEAVAGALRGDSAATLLSGIVRNDQSSRVRMAALEALAELDEDAGLSAIKEIARSAADTRLRSRALEILTER